MPRLPSRIVSTLLSAALLATAAAHADTVQLSNGDSVSGEVILLDAAALTLRSEHLGELHIPRAKVAALFLGEGRVEASSRRTTAFEPVPDQPKLAGAPAPSPAQAAPRPATAAPRTGAAAGTVEDILGQLQNQGVAPQTMQEMQTQFPLLNTPEVQEFFQDRVGGLASGRLNVQDIRGDAVQALDAINDLEKDLGPEAADALRGYKSILQSFVNQTSPEQSEVEVTPPAGIAPPTSDGSDAAGE